MVKTIAQTHIRKIFTVFVVVILGFFIGKLPKYYKQKIPQLSLIILGLAFIFTIKGTE